MSAEEITKQLNDSSATDRAGKYLTFELDNTEFGIEILKVVEILKMMEITNVPMWPGFAKGTINLRGKVIPVIDLRQKFNLMEIEETETTCTIVVELNGDQIGIIVEAVNEVREIAGADIADTPSIGGTVDSEFILGMGKCEGKTIILLSLEKILIETELELLTQNAEMELEPA